MHSAETEAAELTRVPGRPVRGRHAHTLKGPSRRLGSAGERIAICLVAFVPAVVGFITGVYRLGGPPLWRDEAATKAIAGRSVSHILATLLHVDVVHGAYYLVVHVFEIFAGTSSAALRLPSMIAMAVACAFTGLIAHRLTILAGAPFAAFAGVTAGVLFAMAPAMLRYAQEARPFAVVTMLATIATYLLTRAVCERRRWWIGYAIAIALTGLFNILGLLILVSHGISLLVVGDRRRMLERSGHPLLGGPTERVIARLPVRWLIGVASALVVLIPLVLIAYSQRGALSWISVPPIRGATVSLANSWVGAKSLRWPTLVLVVAGIAGGIAADRRRPLTPGVVALPWLVVPPAILIGVSQVHPIYDGRYVEFCLPALAVLIAWGLTWIARLAAATPLRRIGLALLPSTAIAAAFLSLSLPADTAMRLPGSRPDNLLAVSHLVASQEKPGDAVIYLRINARVNSLPFSGPWLELRDIAIAQSPAASNTLYGLDVSPAELLKRFAHVTRVWVVASSTVNYTWLNHPTPVDSEEVRLISGMRKLQQWRMGDMMLAIYEVRSPHLSPAQQLAARLTVPRHARNFFVLPADRGRR